MKRRSRYDPLFERLHRGNEPEVQLSFAEIEALMNATLPPSAREARAWWGNREDGVQAAAWLRAGYRAARVDLDAQQVTFRKDSPARAGRHGGEVVWDGEAIRALRAHMELTQAQFADVLGVRQQTVSEWETGTYMPTRASAKHLARVAEEARFV
jgi:DNA-binding transcriptional regulator YiaG